jgi:cytochrome c556
MFKAVITAGAVLVVVGAAAAATIPSDDPIQSRQNLMKNVGAAMGAAGSMVRGDTEFEPRAAHLAMRTINSSIIGFVEFLAEGSHVGDTRALPAIWENMDDVLAKAESLRMATQAAIDAEPQDLDTFRPLFAEVGQNCRTCHEDYRRPEE